MNSNMFFGLIFVVVALLFTSCSKDNSQVFSITTTSDSNGSITPNLSVKEGANATINFTANDGYQISTIEVDGELTTNANSYVFNNVKANHSITVAFSLIKNVIAYDFSNNNIKINLPDYVENVVEIEAGAGQNLAIQSDGTLIDWENSTSNGSTAPAELNNVVSIAIGRNCYLALKSDGTVVAWGSNEFGQTSVPTDLNGVIAIAAGFNHALALKSDGTVISWGDNSQGQIVPTGLNNVINITAGGDQSIAIKNDGTIVSWGGASIEEHTKAPTNLTEVKSLVAGFYHTVALKSDGTIVVWGDNSVGQMDVPENTKDIVAIDAKSYFTVALKSDGSIIVWGSDNNKQKISFSIDIPNVKAIAAGYGHILVLLK